MQVTKQATLCSPGFMTPPPTDVFEDFTWLQCHLAISLSLSLSLSLSPLPSLPPSLPPSLSSYDKYLVVRFKRSVLGSCIMPVLLLGMLKILTCSCHHLRVFCKFSIYCMMVSGLGTSSLSPTSLMTLRGLARFDHSRVQRG
uniref:Uncharacterized protein n=1 Tax=Sphaerodactylus townsendi TaxID=933632 RepID=A0ACB8FIB2_9SAUR